jgi:hypothetical protein
LDLENDEDNEEKEKFCQQKSREKHDNEDDGSGSGNGGNHPDNPDSNTSKRVRACSFDEFATGSSAVIQYSECSEIDTLSALLTNFDPDNFGMLDAFENCASEYTKSTYGKSVSVIVIGIWLKVANFGFALLSFYQLHTRSLLT